MSITRDGCQWAQDGDADSDMWATGCKHYFVINEGTPRQNQMAYCCYCGRPLVEMPWEDEDEPAGGAQDRSAEGAGRSPGDARCNFCDGPMPCYCNPQRAYL